MLLIQDNNTHIKIRAMIVLHIQWTEGETHEFHFTEQKTDAVMI